MDSSDIIKHILPSNKGISITELKGNFQLYVPNDMINFVAMCEQKVVNFYKLKFSLDLVPYGYYGGEKDGCRRRDSIDPTMNNIRELPRIPEKYELLKIQFVTPIETYMKINHRIRNLKITPGARNNLYNFFSAQNSDTWVKYGKYKKDKFDHFHKEMEKKHGKMTEMEVLDHILDNITESEHNKYIDILPYKGDLDCITTFDKNTHEDFLVTLMFTTTDLLMNMESIFEIFNFLLL